jgi:hypothetical protein
MVAACDNRSDIANVQCALCGTVYSIIYNRKDMVDWMAGVKYIQDALPYLTPAERELLISQTCGDCFDKMFPPDLDIDE